MRHRFVPVIREEETTRKNRLPLGLKLGYSLLVLVWFPIWWVEHGLANFLWFSNIATLVLLFGLWAESRLAVSTMAVAVLAPEIFWNIDFLLQLLTPMDGFGLANYMFDEANPWRIRILSGIVHVALPILLVYGVWRLGYDRRALGLQILLAWIILPLVHFTTDPADNINWTHGPGDDPQETISPLLYLALILAFMPVVVYAPTHWLLRRWAGGP